MAKSNSPKNAPAKTGKPSGKGRGNNPPRTSRSSGAGARGGKKK